MFKHLLVTLDGSPRGETVLPYAADLARSTGAALTLVRIIESAAAEWSEDRSHRQSVRRCHNPFALPGAGGHIPRADRHAAKGNRRAREHDRARRESRETDHCDREGRRRRRHRDGHALPAGISRLMFGSVAEQVLHETNLPVLLIRS